MSEGMVYLFCRYQRSSGLLRRFQVNALKIIAAWDGYEENVGLGMNTERMWGYSSLYPCTISSYTLY